MVHHSARNLVKHGLVIFLESATRFFAETATYCGPAMRPARDLRAEVPTSQDDGSELRLQLAQDGQTDDGRV